ncbi:autotransporter outer membrane beta-barrel domain-containing protein [Bartonella gliris]|uniref:autotransporter outer membrane beta-barrel domain-containing protein n=1 Tax=Bartonella gliris TaxID=3004109 RepID=UPI003873695C
MVLCNSEAHFYKCSDGKKHTITDKTYDLRGSQEDDLIAAISVEGKDTIINASRITVLGDDPDKISTYGVSVVEGGKLILTDSNFKDIPGLRAQDAVINMTNGSIGKSAQAVYASGKKTDIALVTVKIDIEPDSLDMKNMGIASGFGAIIRMSDSTINFNESGSFLTRFGGRYFITSTKINGKGKKESSIVDVIDTSLLPKAFEVFQGGDVHLRGDSIQLTDMHGFLITNFSGFIDERGKLIQKYDLPDLFKKTEIKIESSTISMQGKGVYGLHFDMLDPKTTAEYYGYKDVSKEPRYTLGTASVYLSKTTFTVPNGTVIYTTAPDGYGTESTVKLSDGASISGDLLLKAENNSSISIQADASTLTGGTRVEDVAVANLQLTRGSTWYLTKSKYKDLQESDSIVSSISFLSLSDSTVIFDKYMSKDYQTLHIGREIHAVDRTVYSAQGNVQIKLSAFLNDDGSFDSQKTDRILIYGSVSGTTLVNMENFSRALENKMDDVKSLDDGKNKSVSLIQVAGTAQEDSFKLIDNYTTINGLPYQYRLRAYGPGSSFGKADVKQRLVAGDGDFWDFRLESVYINPKPSSSEFEPTLPPSDKPISISVTPVSSPASPSEPTVPSTSVESAPVPVPSAPPLSPLSTLSVSSESPSVNPKFAPSFPVSSETSSASIPVPPLSTSPSLSSVPSSTVSRELLMDSKSVPTDSLELSPSSSDPSVPSASVAPLSTPSASALSPPDSTAVPSVPVKPDIHPKPRIRAVVPQFPTYLLLPNALFYAGLMDLTTQNKKLCAMRTASHSSLKSDENSAFFARGYGGSHHYVSNLSVFEYGYGAELDYNALEAGVLLKEIESLYGRTLFGVTVTYGNLFLNPRDVLESKKNIFDKLSVSTYGSLQHDTSFYMDGVFSYGLFRGDVFTLARGKTATLKGKQLSTSLTSGKAFATGYNGLIFDPQVQIIYQNLQFYKAHDVDNLDVDLGKFHQWTVRIGGRLTKTLIAHEHITHEEARVVSLYGKFYLLHSFGDRQFVSFKKAFELGMFGSSLEAGLGFNAQLSPKFALHGDATYQQRLSKAGFSGTSFSGGLRYRF